MNTPLHHPVAILKERPFDGRLRVLEVDWSRDDRLPSIAEILDAQEDVPQGFREDCVARVNGELVPRLMWPYVRPKRGCRIASGETIDVVVTFTLPLCGGGGGSGGAHKNPIVTVASIAVLLAATVVSAGAFEPLAASLGAVGYFGAGTTSAALLGAGVGIGGAIEISALKPIRS